MVMTMHSFEAGLVLLSLVAVFGACMLAMGGFLPMPGRNGHGGGDGYDGGYIGQSGWGGDGGHGGGGHSGGDCGGGDGGGCGH